MDELCAGLTAEEKQSNEDTFGENWEQQLLDVAGQTVDEMQSKMGFKSREEMEKCLCPKQY